MSIWQAVEFWLLTSISITIVLPLLAILGWQAYIRLTPAGRAWKAWLDRETVRLNERELDSPLPY